jgi:hypothetical protein
VLSQNGNAVAGAKVTVSEVARGIRQSVLTAADGTYQIPLLAPGRYRVDFVGPEGERVAAQDVELPVGQTLEVNATLPPRGEVFRVEAVGKALPIDFERTSQATSITAEQVDQLPINQRNYLDFARLSPGVTDSDSIANAFDFRPITAPNSGLAFAGSNGRTNTLAIDGIENNGITGDVRLSIAQTAVQEFQVNRSSYSAEYGGALGGAINVVSKSGSNDLRGEVFGYMRQRDLDARNHFDPGKSAYTRAQSGAGAGGPLRRNRTYWFVAFESLNRHESAIVPILSSRSLLTGLTASQSQIVAALGGSGVPALQGTAALLQQLLTPANNPMVAPLFTRNSGVFPFSAAAPLGSIRLDHQISERDSIFFRGNLASDQEQHSQFSPLDGYDRGYNQNLLGGAVMLDYTHRFSPQTFAVTRLAFAYSGTALDPTDGIGPGIDIAGVAGFGRNSTLPFRQYERHLQLQQSFQLQRGHHDWRFGIDLDPARAGGFAESYFGGRFSFGPDIPLSAVLNTATQNPNTSAGLAAVLQSLGRPDLVPHLDDPLNSMQAFALGIPDAYFQGFGNPNVPSGWLQRYSAFAEDTYRVRPGFSFTAGLRLQAENNIGLPAQITADPRVGFAWSPAHASNFVVRGGYGLFHQWTNSLVDFIANAFKPPLSVNLLLVPVTGLPGTVNPYTQQFLTSVDIYQGLLAKGTLGSRPIAFSDLAAFGLKPGFVFPGSGGVDPAYRYPEAQQGSLEIERSFGDLTVSAAYNFERALHLPRTRDHNLYLAGTSPAGSPIFGRRNPAIFIDDTIESTGNSIYNALVLQVQRRFESHFSVNAHYVWSKAIDDVTDMDPDDGPSDPLNLRLDRGLSLFNMTHRFVANAVLESPAEASRWWRGWTFSPIVSANSARPFNILTGYDSLGDGQTNTHRPWGLGRNVGIGPGFCSVDARLGRRVRFGKDGRTGVQFTVEAFNLLNHTNFATVNNIVGATPMAALPHVLVGRAADPTQPFSFTSAYAPRQIQLGLKVLF